MVQILKNYLVRLGPDHWLVRCAVKVRAMIGGSHLIFDGAKIIISKRNRELVLNRAQFVQIPAMLASFGVFFDALIPDELEGRMRLDFSEPRLHRYSRSNVAFIFPSIPEEGQLEAYTHTYVPRAGDIVWDVGAHAGATTYFLSKMVGESGRVYAFEPDETNFEYLRRNIDLHRLNNVVPVKKALAEFSGMARFNMDGTMCAGLSEFLIYSDKQFEHEVETISFEAACASLGCVPNYVKMDIEGAEVAVIHGAMDFLRANAVRFAIESFHVLNGEYTYKPLEGLFRQIGYAVNSSDMFGQMFTWAQPDGTSAAGTD
ncbi:MAG: FkbM family methyltransferase [Terracidiphilus sp.]|nr:FkbM family methyltransferase [Terracidiphilus sp.]